MITKILLVIGTNKPLVIAAIILGLSLFGLGVWGLTRSLGDQAYMAAARSLERQKLPLFFATIGSGAWMYGIVQWMRIVAPVDETTMGPSVIGLGGFAVLAAVIERCRRASALGAIIGTAAGIAVGVVADAAYPMASGADSNLWPLAIVLWVCLATPAVITGLGMGTLGHLPL